MMSNFVGTPHVGGSITEAVLAMGRAAMASLDS
jgi:phosphoglycerate dehydrogenase-like enzyme